MPGWRVEKVSKRDLPKEMDKIMHQVTIGITYPSEEYESVGIMKFPTEWKNKNVPNHQPWQVTIGMPINHCKFNGIIMAFCHISPTNWCRKTGATVHRSTHKLPSGIRMTLLSSPCQGDRQPYSGGIISCVFRGVTKKILEQWLLKTWPFSARYPATKNKFLAGEHR